VIAPEAIAKALDDILRHEGGYVDHSNDRGGPTAYGVTLPTLTEWLGHPATKKDLAALTVDDARSLYRELYMEKPGFMEADNPALFSLLVDSAVLFGRGRTVKWLQTALNVTVDGDMGPMTKAVLRCTKAADVYKEVLALQVEHHGRDITNNPKQAVFAAGWMNRRADFIRRVPT
jgi:lysozyme family protein